MATQKSKSKAESNGEATSTAVATPAQAAAFKRPISQTALKAVSVLIHSQLQSKQVKLVNKIETELFQVKLTEKQKTQLSAVADLIEKTETALGAPITHSSYRSKDSFMDFALRNLRENKRKELMLAAGYVPDPYGRFNTGVDIPSPATIQARLTLSSLGKENFEELLQVVAKDYDLDIKQLEGF